MNPETTNTVAEPTLNLDLIGVHEQENGTTHEKFSNLSFRLTGNRIATMAINDEDVRIAVGAKYDEAADAGERLIFAATGAQLAVATEIADDGITPVPVVKKGTAYYRIAEADVSKPVSLKLIGTRKRGANVSIQL